MILETGTFPTSWTIGLIVPIHKQGNIDNPNIYRGITLLSIFSKVFTSIINKRLVAWGEIMNKTSECQAGFRHGYTTIDNVFVLQSIIQRYLNTRGGKLHALSVDFEKAFDSVDRHKLWAILNTHGVSPKMKILLHNMYENVKACVRNNNEYSDSFELQLGVRQGCILSPFLFSFFINELAIQIENNCENGIQLHR